MYEEENKCITICEKGHKPRRKDRCCVDIIIFILSIILAFTVGLLIGALTGIFIIGAFAALVVFAVILIILIIIRAIQL